MTDPRTAFIHIGPPKTGSTAIQKMMANGREALAAQGFAVPAFYENHSFALAVLFWDEADHDRLAALNGFAAMDRFLAYRRDLFATFEKTVDNRRTPHLLLSGEALARFRRSEAVRMVDWLRNRYERVRVIAYARDPFDWCDSSAQQQVKMSGRSLGQMLDRPPMPDFVLPAVETWRAALKTGAVDLRPFAATDDFDVARDFCAATGIDRARLPAPGDARANERVTLLGAAYSSVANEVFPPFVDFARNPMRPRGIVAPPFTEGASFRLPAETLEAAAPELERLRLALSEACGTELARRARPDRPRRAEIEALMTDGLRRLALDHVELRRRAQNEAALIAYLRAIEGGRGKPVGADPLAHAIELATDRWTLQTIAREAKRRRHTDRHAAGFRLDLMHRIETAAPGTLQTRPPLSRPTSSSPPSTAPDPDPR